MKESAKNILFVFCLMLGRFPLWVLLAGVIFYPRLPLGAFVCFGFAAVVARGYLIAYESGKSITRGTFISAWRYVIRPLGWLILVEISLFALLYLVLDGGKTDWILFFAIFACFILSLASGMLAKKRLPVESGQTVVPRNGVLKAAVVLLWFYFLWQPDGAVWMTASLVLIYVLEFLSTYPYEKNDPAVCAHTQ